MKKTMLNILIGFVLGLFVSTYASYLYKASDILYVDSDGKNTSVQEAIRELKEKNVTIEELIPEMTSNSSNGVTISSSSEYYSAYKAVDRDNTTNWMDNLLLDGKVYNNTSYNKVWWQIDLGKKVYINWFEIDIDFVTSEYELLGSNDGVNFELIDKYVHTYGHNKEYFKEIKEYRYIRINFVKQTPSTTAGYHAGRILEFQLYGMVK